MSKPGASSVRPPSSVDSARKVAANSGGTASSCRVTRRKSSVNKVMSGAPAGRQVPDEQRPDRPLQRLLVQVVGPGGHLEQGVGERGRVAPVQGEQQPLQRGAQPGVQAADRAEVDQPQPPVVEQQDVARVRVGVEDAVDDDLPQHAVEQVTGEPLAIGVGRGGLAQRRAVEPLHDQHLLGAQVVMDARDHHARAALAALAAARFAASIRKSSSSRSPTA